LLVGAVVLEVMVLAQTIMVLEEEVQVVFVQEHHL
jgi:hypothetical protein